MWACANGTCGYAHEVLQEVVVWSDILLTALWMWGWLGLRVLLLVLRVVRWSDAVD